MGYVKSAEHNDLHKASVAGRVASEPSTANLPNQTAYGQTGSGRILTLRLILFFLLPLVVLTATIQLRDPDTWWLLARGKLFFQQGISVTNTFSFTHPNHPWQCNYWLFGSLLYLGEIIGWPYAVQFVSIVFVFAMVCFLTCTTLKASGDKNLFLFVVLLVLVVVSCRFRFVPRPHLASYLGLSILYYLWQRQPRWLLLWAGLLGMVWANFHAGVIFGAISFLLLGFGSTLERNWSLVKRAVLAMATFSVCSLFNPDIFSPYIYAIEHAWKFDALNIKLTELAPPGLRDYSVYYFLVALALLAIWPRIRAKDFTFPVFVVFWLAFSLKANRGIPYFAIATLPGIYAGGVDVYKGLVRLLRHRWLSRGLAILCLVVVILLINREIWYRSDYLVFGLGVNERLLPVGVSDFIEKENFTGQMYNDFGDGGFLIWRFFPGRRVFQDGRTQAYPNDFLKTFNSKVPYRTILSALHEYGVKYAVVERHAGYEDVGNLLVLAGWPMVYLDGHNAMFVRPGYLDEKKLARLALRAIPYHTTDHVAISGDRAMVLSELRRIDPERLLFEDDFIRFAFAALRISEFELAERFFRAGLAYVPGSSQLKFEADRFLQFMGREAL